MKTSRQILKSLSRRFTLSVALALVCVFVLLQAYLIRQRHLGYIAELQSWVGHNSSRLEEFLFIDNLEALNGIVVKFKREMEPKGLTDISLYSWDGKLISSSDIGEPKALGSSLVDGFESDLISGDIVFSRSLVFADKFMGRMVVKARLSNSAVWRTSLLLAGGILLFFFVVLSFRLSLTKSLADSLIEPIQMLRTQMKAGLVLDFGLSEKEKRDNWSSEAFELERTYVELIQKLDLLSKKKANEAKMVAAGQVAAQVAHDIRSPLTALEIGISSIPEIEPEIRELIQTAVSRIKTIANDLLKGDRQKIPGTAAVEETTVSSLSKAISSVVEEKRLCHGVRLNAGLSIEYDIDLPDIRPLQREVGQLSRVLSNIIENAVEAIPNVGTVTVFAKEDGGRIEFRISDTGTGIAADVLPQLGVPGVTVGKAAGSGLGLSGAKELVTGWGGSFEIESKISSGTTVSFAIPTKCLT